MTHDVLAVGLELGAWACAIAVVVEPADAAEGTKQAA
jgi:hypothetical protein